MEPKFNQKKAYCHLLLRKVRRKKTRHKALLHFIPLTVKQEAVLVIELQNQTKKKNFIKRTKTKHQSVSNNWRSPFDKIHSSSSRSDSNSAFTRLSSAEQHYALQNQHSHGLASIRIARITLSTDQQQQHDIRQLSVSTWSRAAAYAHGLVKQDCEKPF